MIEPAADRVLAALAPVRAALLARAAADGRRAVAAAQQEVDAAVARATEQAAELLAEAVAAGEADAALVLRTERVRARRAARTAELAAQREAYRQLTERVRAAVRERVPAGLRDWLADRARAVLGPDTVVLDAPDGGVIGQAPGRRLDLSLTAAADRAVAELGSEVTQLWAP